ncbi:amidase [Paraburkholderia caballeronis]|uniref:Amidase/6-aminohexanoate-cyclic-dimer hydrolase n=1 Tax=Paraburkholderia caballeronis TaxID=416943 RepID=A0A1H7HJL6_9BURK|nr:amidase [Paraburkholderia caballeronis]PXW29497.1 amidase/6-aminohexanoate-cyclic-dimer hydrolase [Paraburkholderia caballeronis]PXX04756.1 amidase/6-aminohexanoate-cyclic-dimer hydrolase [Paraburkholderia caballeronis]RAK05817.1 amidase/6-aminohexanoate-cyclic-dimer hydrolase [Paraburkholderia caballeronis]SEB41305.1 amidase [Paraburkholderia caballeronis]SEK49827.1 amidase/6-aminohexanoate-cyclic-dimer hydrolase [Paraburkholderia caballeronis]
MQSDYLSYDAIGLAELVKSREASARELLDTAIARAEAVNPAINALVLKDYDAARRRAARNGDGADALAPGPLAGVPFLVKDLGAPVAGLPMTLGSRHYRHFVPTADAPVVTRIRDAGLNIFGKTSTPELGQMPYTEPELFGPCRNPWNLDHTPGGSSGGAAASVAAGIVPLAHASDGGGSIRIPASCCGLFGLKPSRSRQTPGNPPPPPGALGVDLAVSRSVRDSALMLDLLTGDPGLAPGSPGTFLAAAAEPCKPLTIAFVTDPMFAGSLSADVRAALDDAAALAESLGHRIEPVSLSIDFAQAREAFLMLWSVVAEQYVLNAADLSGHRPRRREFEVATWALAHIGRKLGERELPAALDTQRRITTQFADLMTRYDALLCATLAAAPVKIGELRPTQAERLQMHAVTALPMEALMRRLLTEASNKAFAWAGCTELFNLTGQPAMSVPLWWNARGLPVGVQFAAREGNDALLLRLASQLEAARPWFGRRPPLLSARA